MESCHSAPNGEGPSANMREKLNALEALFESRPLVQAIPTVVQGNLPDTMEMLRALEDYPAADVKEGQ